VAVGIWGIQPSEFWRMSPQEFWALVEDKAPEPRKAGLPASTFDRLSRMLDA